MDAETADLLKISLSFLAASSYLVGWMSLSPQLEFPRSIARSVAVVIRTLIIYGGVWAVFCYGMKFSSNDFAVFAALLIILLTRIPRPTQLEDPSGIASVIGGDQIGGGFIFAIWMMFLLPLMLLREFVLGNAMSGVASGISGSQADAKCLPAEPMELQGQLAVVISPLKPSGMVEVAGQKLAACSDAGMFVASGTQVRVCGERNGMLIVRVVNE